MIMKCPYVGKWRLYFKNLEENLLSCFVFMKDCEEKFRVRSTYHAHVKRHRTEKQQPSTIYVCVLQNCQYTTSNKASMKQHLTKVHDYKQEKGKYEYTKYWFIDKYIKKITEIDRKCRRLCTSRTRFFVNHDFFNYRLIFPEQNVFNGRISLVEQRLISW